MSRHRQASSTRRYDFSRDLHRNLFGTGGLTADPGGNRIIHRDLVIVDSGKEVELVTTDAGLVISG